MTIFIAIFPVHDKPCIAQCLVCLSKGVMLFLIPPLLVLEAMPPRYLMPL